MRGGRVDHSGVRFCVGWKDPPPAREDQKRYAVDSAAAFLRDELQKTENIVKIKEVIVHDSRDDEEDDEDDFYCYYVRQPEKHG